MNARDIRKSFYDLFAKVTDRPVERWSAGYYAIGESPSIVLPSSKLGRFHNIFVTPYAGEWSDPTRLTPRIAINHFGCALSCAAGCRWGGASDQQWQLESFTLELTVTLSELPAWAEFVWGFILAREANDIRLLTMPPTSVERSHAVDWMVGNYAWTQSAADQHRHRTTTRPGTVPDNTP